MEFKNKLNKIQLTNEQKLKMLDCIKNKRRINWSFMFRTVGVCSLALLVTIPYLDKE